MLSATRTDSESHSIQWQTNSLNEASRRAAERLGYMYEGTWRNAQIDKGRSRNTAWFSMIDDEWPVVCKALERWLDSGNFDEHGAQVERLQDIRASLVS